jgi:hypothetical protein
LTLSHVLTRRTLTEAVWTFSLIVNVGVTLDDLVRQHWRPASLQSVIVLLLVILRYVLWRVDTYFDATIRDAETHVKVAEHALAQVERAMQQGTVRMEITGTPADARLKGRMH